MRSTDRKSWQDSNSVKVDKIIYKIMATSGQELSFGDFGDLSPEENERIFHILHGQKHFPARVEFPWDGEIQDLTGADRGNAYSLEKVQGIPEEPPPSEYPVYQESEFTFGTVRVSELSYGMETKHIISFDDSDKIQPIEKQLDSDPLMQGDRNTQSKLQASLKPYERRNKKKRPPDYYKEQTEESQSTFNCVESFDNPEDSVHPEMLTQHSDIHVYTTIVPSYDVKYNYTEDMNRNMPVEGHCMTYTPSNNDLDTHPNQGLTFTSSLSSADVHNTNVTNRLDNNQHVELQEILVDSNVKAYTFPARTETYEVQDHVRTSSAQNESLDGHGYSGVQSTMAVPTYSDNSYINQINSNVQGYLATVDDSGNQGLTIPGNSSQLQTVHSDHQIDSGVNISQEVSGNVAPEEITQDKPYAEHVEKGDISGSRNVYEVSVEVNNIVNTNVTTNSVDVNVDPTKLSNASGQGDMKPMRSWAGLFKSSSTSSATHPVISDKIENSMNTIGNDQAPKQTEKEFSPVPVNAKDDSVAKELGELLSKMTISHASVYLQPRGLVNRGNWCYINGTLQALVACPPFYNLLEKIKKYLSPSRGSSSTPILDSLIEFISEFHQMPKQYEKGQRNKGLREISPGPPFEPSYVYKMLQAIAVNPHFKLGKQEDAEEFLSCILVGAHEEMAAAVNLTNKQPPQSGPTEPTEEEGYTNGYYHADEEEEMQDDENWEQVGPKKKSVLTRRSSFAKTPIADIFAGMIRSGVHKASAKETATLEPFFTLQLDIQSEKVESVRDALAGLVSKEIISGYTDSKTNSEVEVVKKLSLEELPPVLILHLKFFVYNKDGGSQKLMKKVEYPVELEITKDLLSPNAKNKLNMQQRSYKLFAVVYHHGKHMTGGHYTTCVFHPGINGWVLSDDSTVKTVHTSTVLKYIPPRVPYLLYYRRLDSGH